MKTYKLILAMSLMLLGIYSCKDDENNGNPVISSESVPASAYFGDSISFSATVTDEIPLSTLKAQIYYSDVMVSEEVIRTKTNGQYGGKIFVPFMKNIPNGNATIKLVLQNIRFTSSETSSALALTRPDFPSLTLVLEDETELTMLKTAANVYSISGNYPRDVYGHIVAPAYGANGNEITFGMSGGAITEGSTDNIHFRNNLAGNYSLTFNTYSYEASPYFQILVNGTAMDVMDDETFSVIDEYKRGATVTITGINISEWNLGGIFTISDGKAVFNLDDGEYKIMANVATKTFSYIGFGPVLIDFTIDDTFESEFALNQEITFDGIDDDWWLDPDFFVEEDDHYLFNALRGKYRFTVNRTLKYIVVEAMTGNSLATLQSDGTGAIWIIGTNIGKPSVTDNEVGWNTDKALCMAPIGNKKYRVTVIAGTQVTADDINFKFFHQKGWGGEFGGGDITTTSDIVFVGNGDNGRDGGNLGISSGKKFTAGKTYEFVVDVSGGNSNAVLTVTAK